MFQSKPVGMNHHIGETVVMTNDGNVFAGLAKIYMLWNPLKVADLPDGPQVK